MPELPEVETIRHGLEKFLLGREIEKVEVLFPKILTGNVNDILNTPIIHIRRFGKGLVIDFANEYSLAVHVKMTGQLIYVSHTSPNPQLDWKKVGELPGKHTHLVFMLSAKRSAQSGDHLYYNDTRKFGWLHIGKTSEIADLAFFKHLGPEPLSSLTLDQFLTIIRKPMMPIKNLLLDQRRIAGIGNIYANDALYLAGIHPTRAASSITKEEGRSLFNAIEQVLKKGIEVGGASEWSYVNVLGESGGYQNFFQVYGKNGKPCTRCGATIEKIALGGRGTFFCPKCQR